MGAKWSTSVSMPQSMGEAWTHYCQDNNKSFSEHARDLIARDLINKGYLPMHYKDHTEVKRGRPHIRGRNKI